MSTEPSHVKSLVITEEGTPGADTALQVVAMDLAAKCPPVREQIQLRAANLEAEPED